MFFLRYVTTSSRLASRRLMSRLTGNEESLPAKARMVSTSRKSCSACWGVILVSVLDVADLDGSEFDGSLVLLAGSAGWGFSSLFCPDWLCGCWRAGSASCGPGDE